MNLVWEITLAITAWVIFIAVMAWLVLPWLARAPKGDPITGLIWRLVRVYARVMHRARFTGLERLRRQLNPGPLVVVSNHTGAVDPLLIQAGCRFDIRWMMASEMMTPALDWLWERQELIPVDRDGRDSGPAREAIRHVQNGGVIGIFPEGRIVQPPEEIRPFYTGVGLIVTRTQAPVLLVWVSGTPNARTLAESLTTPSRAHVHYVEVIDFAGERDGHVITQRLRERLAEVSGWPLNDEPLPSPARPLEAT